MEILKTTLIAVLIWGVAIWFARFMKRKSKEQAKKFEARMPEMEPVTEEERRYICKMLVDYTPAKNVVLWILFFFNLFIVIALGCELIRIGISGDDGKFFDGTVSVSAFIIITYIVHVMRLYNIECKQQYEQGELKKSIVKVLEELKKTDNQTIMDLYQNVKINKEMSLPTFMLCLDWLYLIEAVKMNERGDIQLCL